MEIEVQNLTFSYGKQPVLQDVSFSVQKGTLTAVLGANGAGKSTLFRCLLGFLTPQAGEIRLSGRPLSAYSRREAAGKLAYIPQSSEPIFNYTVLDTVLMGTTGTMNVLQRPGRRQQEAAMQALQRLGIEALAQRGIGTISGGERQLALIARALVQNAEILIMDEPPIWTMAISSACWRRSGRWLRAATPSCSPRTIRSMPCTMLTGSLRCRAVILRRMA